MEGSPGKYKFALAADIRYNNDRNNDFQLRYIFVIDTSGRIENHFFNRRRLYH